MSIDGKQIAQEILAATKIAVSTLPHPPKVVAYVAESPTPATRSYLNIKKRSAEAAGCVFEETNDPSAFAEADAAIVQLPVPEGVSLDSLLTIEKDADVLSKAAREKFERGDRDALLPPVVGAIAEIFQRCDVNPKGKRAVVIGAGFLVGGPAAVWLTQQGADVFVLTSKSDVSASLLDADIIVSGAGVPSLIKPEMLKPGVVLIDAGTAESNGVIAGDADPACAEVASVFTPVPGGVGPIGVACLFANVAKLVTGKR
jgi:methylenetetrahydrofolate dehydrogenase (NADP+)/methenyltetrahydrofolate cyclohydrolase